MQFILLIHLSATQFMVGVIWFVQVVHYPLFSAVGREQFTGYEQQHQRLTTWVVAPVMLVEVITAVLLLNCCPSGMPAVLAWIGFALLGGIWLSTWAVQVPAHTALSGGFSSSDHSRLVASNWLRTAAWTLRGILVCAMTFLSIN